MNKVVLVSFDAVGSDEISILENLPNFQKLFSHGTMFRNMQTIFVSNTYPVHSSIATGVYPVDHGLVCNKLIEPDKCTLWNYDSRLLKHKTLWQAAAEKGLKIGNVLWPVTAHSKSIKWNIPEIAVPAGKSQLRENLKSGSVMTQLKEYMRFGKILHGVQQPDLDTFAIHGAADILSSHHPDLMLLHLTCYDSFCHKYGRMSRESIEMLHFLDNCLGSLIRTCRDEYTFIVFSDHAQINIHDNISLNRILEEAGYLMLESDTDKTFGGEAFRLTDYRCFFNYTGGSAFFFNNPSSDNAASNIRGAHTKNSGNSKNRCLVRPGLGPQELDRLKQKIGTIKGIKRFLTDEELKLSGYSDYPFSGGAVFGVTAEDGWHFDDTNAEKATHGFTLDREHYGTFCAVNKENLPVTCKSVLDITRLVASELELNMK